MITSELQSELIDKFVQYFPGNRQEIRLFFAPGRVNLIGEHTDYNGGYVFPAALTMGTYMVIRERTDEVFCLRSENFPDSQIDFNLNELKYRSEDSWGNYPKGIVKELVNLQSNLTGADILYYGNIPNGAGLSSSASIGMVTVYGLCELAKKELTREEMALLCQRMENHFIGVNTGIMDQMAVGLGEKDHALFLNCQTLAIETVPLKLGNYRLVITNTNKQRGLADSKYNERRDQCQQGLSILQKARPNIENLGDLKLNDFQELESLIKDPIIKARVRHVITENERVVLAKEKLQANELLEFGKLMEQSHISLRDDYEVTGKELDTLFEIQRETEGCIGTRMTGAGFGGCTVSLVEETKIDEFKQSVAHAYEDQIGYPPAFYVSDIGDGVKAI